jgi:hypothetical protein
MHKAETHLQPADRHIRGAEYDITRQELIAKLEQGGQTAARPHASDLLTAMLAGRHASCARFCGGIDYGLANTLRGPVQRRRDAVA